MKLTQTLVPPSGWTAHGVRFAVGDETGDVRVVYGTVPHRLDAAVSAGRYVDASPEDFLFRPCPDVRIRARRGCEIVLDAPADHRLPPLGAWLHGPVTVAILYQRGLTPFHASAVEISGGCVAFLGNSGMGKSSLAAAAIAEGAHLVTDDVLVVTTGSGGGLTAFRGPPVLRIPPQTFQRMGTAAPLLEAADDGKLLLHAASDGAGDSIRLVAVFLLDEGDSLTTERLRGTTLYLRLRSMLQRPGLARVLGAETRLLETLGAVANGVPVWRLQRPAQGWTLPACLGLVRRELALAGVRWGNARSA